VARSRSISIGREVTPSFDESSCTSRPTAAATR
jgi:hypothetical protein